MTLIRTKRPSDFPPPSKDRRTQATPDEVKTARDLRKRGYSIRIIAKRLGRSEGCVRDIFRPKYAKLRRLARRRERRKALALASSPVYPPVGEKVRCGGCGGLVYAPCVLCGLRAKAEKSGKKKSDTEATSVSQSFP